jgi:predicted permease
MGLLSRLRNVFRAGRVADEIDREMRFHLAEREDDLVASGLPREAARQEARRRFGNYTRQKEETLERDRLAWLDATIGDVRYALRVLRAAPAFTTVAILSLALGIGASTAVFSVLNALLMKRLDVADPDALISLVRDAPGSESPSFQFSFRELARLRERSTTLSGVFGYQTSFQPRMRLPGGGTDAIGENVRAPMVTSGFFSTLGVGAVLGRTFADGDEAANEPEPGVVLSDEFWTRRFGRDPQVIGRPIVVVRDYPFTIIGVAQPMFSGIEVGQRPDMWIPLASLKRMNLERLLDASVTIMGRLRPGVTLGAARAEVRTILDKSVDVRPGATGQAAVLRSRFGRPLLLLMASVGLVLLIASVNVAALMIARGAARRSELAVRVALGSGRARLVRQLVTESAVLAILAAIAGVALARWGIELLLSFAPAEAALSLRTGLDLRVLGFTIATVVSSTLLFGVLPAWRSANVEPRAALASGRFGALRGALPMQRLLVVVQIGLTVVLLMSAGVLLRTLRNLRHADPGFARGVLVFQVNGGAVRPDVARRVIVPRLETIPGVESASFFANLGLLGGNAARAACAPDGEAPRGPDRSCATMSVGRGFFETLRIRLLQGRVFAAGDEAPNPGVVVINAALARQAFGGANPLGRRLDGREVIGVVDNTAYSSIRNRDTPIVYALVGAGVPIADVRFTIRARGPAAGLTSALRSAVREVTPAPITLIETVDDRAEATLVRERFLVGSTGTFSGLALLLACVGLYGTLAYAVTVRTSEIGVRMALGASATDLVRMLLIETSATVASGLVLGLSGAVAATRLLSAYLYGLEPTDPLTMAAVVALLVSATTVAAYLPSRRASRVDPNVTLRHA